MKFLMKSSKMLRLHELRTMENVKHKTPSADSPDVYTTLQALMQLQFDIRGFSFLPKQPVQSLLTGRHRSKLRGRGLDFEEVRNYVPGDDVRMIDWKVTARTQKPHTKVYTEERERPVYVIVDQSSSMFFGSRKMMKSVTAAQAAALAMWKVLAVGDRVGGAVFNDQDLVEFTPKRNRKIAEKFLGEIVRMNNELNVSSLAGQNGKMLNEVLIKSSNKITHDYLVIMISDFQFADAITVKELRKISRHNDVILVKVFDPMEKELPESELVLSDGSNQLVFDGRTEALRAKHRASFESKLDALKENVENYNITVLPVNTIEPIVDQVRKLIGSKR